MHGEQDETKYNVKFHHFGVLLIQTSRTHQSGTPGQWKGTKDAAIFEFMPGAYTTYTNVKKALLNNDASVYWDAFHIDALEKSNKKSRSEMAEACLMKWDLLAKIGLANELINPEKDRRSYKTSASKASTVPLRSLICILTKLIDMLNVDQ
ncbi:unnamed protein product [Auanema sp. JU1783]|nr:unnamed protein product [Auanema sp. JU1783]